MKNPSTIFLIAYIIIIFFCIMNEVTMSENLIETNGKIFLFGFIMTLLEIPIIFYLVWKMILKNIVNAMFYDENEKKVASF